MSVYYYSLIPIFRGFCPQGVLSSGFLSAGFFIQGILSAGGFVLRGFCPDTVTKTSDIRLLRTGFASRNLERWFKGWMNTFLAVTDN